MFIIIAFSVGSDELVCCLFYCLSQGMSRDVTPRWGRVDDFSLSIVEVLLFLLIEFQYVLFFISYTNTLYLLLYCTLLSCFFTRISTVLSQGISHGM